MKNTIYHENHTEVLYEEYFNENSLLKIKWIDPYYSAVIQYIDLGVIRESVLFHTKEPNQFLLDISPDQKIISVFSDQELMKVYDLEDHSLVNSRFLDVVYNQHYRRQVDSSYQLVKRK